jgi:FKBP-type peptidyl-prolyl cis-trans isomerase FkpA
MMVLLRVRVMAGQANRHGNNHGVPLTGARQSVNRHKPGGDKAWLSFIMGSHRTQRKIHMKQLMRSGLIGLALTLTLAACNREKTPQAPAAAAIPMQQIDTLAGTGKEAVAGATAVVNYTGWLYEPKAASQHGAQFDSSMGRAPFSFQLGAGQVIPGWDAGVKGMKVGGKRTLIVPASMGYGENGAGPIPPNANLIFDVELLDVR